MHLVVKMLRVKIEKKLIKETIYFIIWARSKFWCTEQHKCDWYVLKKKMIF